MADSRSASGGQEKSPLQVQKHASRASVGNPEILASIHGIQTHPEHSNCLYSFVFVMLFEDETRNIVYCSQVSAQLTANHALSSALACCDEKLLCCESFSESHRSRFWNLDSRRNGSVFYTICSSFHTNGLIACYFSLGAWSGGAGSPDFVFQGPCSLSVPVFRLDLHMLHVASLAYAVFHCS